MHKKYSVWISKTTNESLMKEEEEEENLKRWESFLGRQPQQISFVLPMHGAISSKLSVVCPYYLEEVTDIDK